MNGMVRPPNDGVHLETPQAQTGSSSEGIRSATSGNTPCAKGTGRPKRHCADALVYLTDTGKRQDRDYSLSAYILSC